MLRFFHSHPAQNLKDTKSANGHTYAKVTIDTDRTSSRRFIFYATDAVDALPPAIDLQVRHESAKLLVDLVTPVPSSDFAVSLGSRPKNSCAFRNSQDTDQRPLLIHCGHVLAGAARVPERITGKAWLRLCWSSQLRYDRVEHVVNANQSLPPAARRSAPLDPPGIKMSDTC